MITPGGTLPKKWSNAYRQPRNFEGTTLRPYAVKYLANMVVTDLIKRLIKYRLPPLAGPINTYHDVLLLQYTLSRLAITQLSPDCLVWNSRPKNFKLNRLETGAPKDMDDYHWAPFDIQMLPHGVDTCAMLPPSVRHKYAVNASYWGYAQGAPASSDYEIDGSRPELPISSTHYLRTLRDFPALAENYTQLLLPQLSFSIRHQIGVPSVPQYETYYEDRNRKSNLVRGVHLPEPYKARSKLNNINDRSAPDHLSYSWLGGKAPAQIQDLRYFYEPTLVVLRRHYPWLINFVEQRWPAMAVDMMNHTRLSGPAAMDADHVAKYMDRVFPAQVLTKQRPLMLAKEWDNLNSVATSLFNRFTVLDPRRDYALNVPIPMPPAEVNNNNETGIAGVPPLAMWHTRMEPINPNSRCKVRTHEPIGAPAHWMLSYRRGLVEHKAPFVGKTVSRDGDGGEYPLWQIPSSFVRCSGGDQAEPGQLYMRPTSGYRRGPGLARHPLEYFEEIGLDLLQLHPVFREYVQKQHDLYG